ncbi:hypothetical protein IVB34_47825 [Bradyrhizobium sp. 2]|uniref:hypothetical protein n=1 Tax=Bradyrhizobium sp. 2 TaxID=190045 RepID=UPI001FF9BFDF|nr:hypothetical protein [Bradyrhizobium sp. 2]MCK1465740.1 hypothetical protein [Bradyrhizobium sp. 2]MCK1465798.1 hypothetical protein [Bradyrhizobium sp. 2]
MAKSEIINDYNEYCINDPASSVLLEQNGAGTNKKIDTPLTQQSSGDVLTLAGLIEAYRTHKASSFHKLAYDNRKNTRRLTERMDEQYGSTPLAEIRASTIRIWHDGWAEEARSQWRIRSSPSFGPCSALVSNAGGP